jgi:hypothetical protein
VVCLCFDLPCICVCFALRCLVLAIAFAFVEISRFIRHQFHFASFATRADVFIACGTQETTHANIMKTAVIFCLSVAVIACGVNHAVPTARISLSSLRSQISIIGTGLQYTRAQTEHSGSPYTFLALATEVLQRFSAGPAMSCILARAPPDTSNTARKVL